MQKEDKVWFDLPRRFAGIAGEVKSLSSTHNVLVLAHFPATLSAVEASLRAVGITFETFSFFDSNLLCGGVTETVLIGLARALQQPNTLSRPAANRSVRVIVCEHYPKAVNDRVIIDAVQKFPCPAEVQFHISLDDPLLERFGGEKLRTLMKTLGMDESESIKHRFVTSAIRNAQEKLEAKVPRELPTESISDWFKFNLRSPL